MLVQPGGGVNSVRGERLLRARLSGIDALVLWWNTIPRDPVAEVYLPDVPVAEIEALIPSTYAHTLMALDDHTLRCIGLGDCSVIPLPELARGRTVPGLLTIGLPHGSITVMPTNSLVSNLPGRYRSPVLSNYV